MLLIFRISGVHKRGGFKRVVLADVSGTLKTGLAGTRVQNTERQTPKTRTRVQETERRYQKPDRGHIRQPPFYKAALVFPLEKVVVVKLAKF